MDTASDTTAIKVLVCCCVLPLYRMFFRAAATVVLISVYSAFLRRSLCFRGLSACAMSSIVSIALWSDPCSTR